MKTQTVEISDTSYHDLSLHTNNKPPKPHSQEWFKWMGSDFCPVCQVAIVYKAKE